MLPLSLIFGKGLVDQVIREFGIEGESDEAKAYLLGQLADNISGRILLEVTKLVPLENREEFIALCEGDDANALASFVRQRVPDWEEFVRTEAQKEIERTRVYLLEMSAQAPSGGGQ